MNQKSRYPVGRGDPTTMQREGRRSWEFWGEETNVDRRKTESNSYSGEKDPGSILLLGRNLKAQEPS